MILTLNKVQNFEVQAGHMGGQDVKLITVSDADITVEVILTDPVAHQLGNALQGKPVIQTPVIALPNQ